MTQKVVVAMSGGVDSSVAAAILHQQGYDAVGISMQVWDYRNHGGSASRATCCAPSDFTDARQVAQRIGIPYYVFDFEESFKEKVIDNFVSLYSKGLTPNPCVECNRRVKFAELRKRAKFIGAPAVATGHYARIRKSDQGFHLLRGEDDAKDQSYFLWALSQQELSETLFPVGHLSKSEVREMARELGLVTADKAESQDICFVSGKLKNFLNRMGVEQSGGNVVSTKGQILGQHDGVHSFTVGQRRGINVGGQESALYVVGLNPETSQVIVGTKEDLERESFYVSELNFCNLEMNNWWNGPAAPYDCLVQIRYRQRGVPARIEKKNGILKVTFESEQSAVSPGQFAVFYDLKNEEVLGGGRILHERETESLLN